MSNARIKLKLTGFDALLSDIERAGGSIDDAVTKAVQQSADVVESELRATAAAANVPASITNEIKSETTAKHDVISASVGWKLGAYDPENPSTGYEALFLNYGTIKRQTEKGANRGSLAARGFIQTAAKKSGKKVKEIQGQTLNDIMGGLSK